MTISLAMARELRDADLRWHPLPGDAFCIDRVDLEGDVFTVSEMTIEAHEFDTGTVLGFNGTTEWALDSVALEDALWLPREDQLRLLLGNTFRSLRAVDDVLEVELQLAGETQQFEAPDAADAYALALRVLLEAVLS